MSPKIAPSPQPYGSDVEHLDAEAAYLKTRCARIAAERAVEVAREQEAENDVLAHRPGRATARETACRARELLAREESLRAEIDGRLDATRATGFVVGIDKLREQHDLCGDETLIVVALALQGIGQRLVDTFGDLAFFGAPTVEALCALLDPKTVGEWLGARRLFRSDGALVGSGLLVLAEPRGEATPSTLMVLDVSLSMDAFAVLVGDPGIARELDPVRGPDLDPN